MKTLYETKNKYGKFLFMLKSGGLIGTKIVKSDIVSAARRLLKDARDNGIIKSVESRVKYENSLL